MILETLCVGPLEVNCYVLAARKAAQAVIIDPGAGEQKIRQALKKHGLTPAFIINTHGHYDHIGCDDKFGVPVFVHSKDALLLKDPNANLSGFFAIPYKVAAQVKTVEDGDMIESDDLSFKVLHVPGHTPGGIALLMKSPVSNILFTGDALFCGGIGRSDFAGGDQGLLIKGIKEKLLTLPEETICYPGHGPSTTIGREKQENPFLEDNT